MARMRASVRGRAAALALMAVLGLATARSSLSCAFDGVPSGDFGIAHLGAIEVWAALRRAYDDGALTEGRRAPGAGGLSDLFRARALVMSLSRAAGSASAIEARGMEDVYLLLAGPSLWTRLSPSPSGIHVTFHADRPTAEAAVIITDLPVLEAWAHGVLTLAEAAGRDLILARGGDASGAMLQDMLAFAAPLPGMADQAERRSPWASPRPPTAGALR